MDEDTRTYIADLVRVVATTAFVVACTAFLTVPYILGTLPGNG